MVSEKAASKFLSHLGVGVPDECWEWQGRRGISRYGKPDYGVFKCGGTAYLAHRVAYHLFQGEIPPGLLVCHHCDNPACCNPTHLWLGTIFENNRDRSLKGRTARVYGKHPERKYLRGENHKCNQNKHLLILDFHLFTENRLR